jgi:hypothetical protein
MITAIIIGHKRHRKLLRITYSKSIAKRFIVLTFFFLFFCLTLHAQKRIASVVIWPDGLPLSGVSVLVKGTDMATISADDGSFTVTVSTGDVLVFSCIGYKSREIKIGNEITLKLSLSESIINLTKS